MPQTFEAEESRTLEVQGYSQFTLENANGNINVEGIEGDSLVLRAVKKVRAAAEEEAKEHLEAIRIEVLRSCPVLTVKTEAPHLKSRQKCSVDYTVRIPRILAVSLGTVNGNVDAHGTGPSEVRTVNGNINIRAVGGPAEAHTVNGNVHASEIRGPAGVKVVNGNVDIDGAEGSVSANAVNGNIQASLTRWEAEGKSALTALNGNLHLAVPLGTSARIVATTVTGRIDCRLPVTPTSQGTHRLEGTLGAGQGEIILRTSHGNIRILAAG